jgi:CheY-like chemotaxis protein
MAKEASVIVLDINTRDLDLGISAARAIVQQKLLFTKRDEIGT